MTRISRTYYRVIAVYAAFIAASAYFGAIGMISGLLAVPDSLAERLPFGSTVFGGTALALVVALPCTALTVLAWRRHPRTADAAPLTGLLLVGWIVVEVATVRQFSMLQVVFGLAGIGLVLVGNLRWRTTDAEATKHDRAAPAAGDEAPVVPSPADRPETNSPGATPPWCIDLYWLPLGAGGHCVRLNGRVYEALAAWYGHRPARDLYHAALEVHCDGRRYVIEMAPVWNDRSPERGVVREGPVGARWLGSFRAFRYEVRCWPDGRIPDRAEAVDSPRRLSDDPAAVTDLLRTIQRVPALTWGRDELGAGDMWNSNSLVSWVLASTGHDMSTIIPPADGRAPGWSAGLLLSGRAPTATGERNGVPR